MDIGGGMTETQSRTGKASLFRILAVGRNPKRTLVRAAVLAVACLVVFKWVLLPVRVEGISMAPTYLQPFRQFRQPAVIPPPRTAARGRGGNSFDNAAHQRMVRPAHYALETHHRAARRNHFFC